MTTVTTMSLERNGTVSTGFVSTFSGVALGVDYSTRQPLAISPQRHPSVHVFMSGEKKKGLFGKLKEQLWKPIVTVPGGGGRGDLLECVFCKGTGECDCDACKGSGKDALGTCLMCDGKTRLTCTVCSGIGAVDRIRRGGTDDRNTYTTKEKI